MSRPILILAILIIFAGFVISACGPQDTADKKPEEKKVETTETESETPATMEGETGVETPDETGDETVDEGEAPDPASTVSGGASAEEGTVSTVDEDDGTVKVVDSDGQVIATTTSDGDTVVEQTEDGSVTTTGPGLTAGPSITPSAGAETPAQPPEEDKPIKSRGDVRIRDKVAIIKTNFGDMYLFFFDYVAPRHVRNFIYLAEKDFYRDVKFHRIVKGFMAQAGIARDDWTEDIPMMKLEVDPTLNVKHRTGSLAAARTNDPNSATSQWYIAFSTQGTERLNRQYTVFGQMFDGFDVLDKLENIKLDWNPNGPGGQPEQSIPAQNVYIIDVVIVDAEPYTEQIDAWKSENEVE